MKSIVYDTRLLKHIRPALRIDAIKIERSNGTQIDSEGDPMATPTHDLVLEGRGTLDAINDTERLVASQRGTNIDRALLVERGMDLLEGDWVTVNGVTLYEVVEVADRRLARRALLRRLK